MKSEEAPIVIMNPMSDREFVGRTLQLVNGHETPAALQVVLREHYPDAIVRKRELDGEQETWYVYRDGHWVPPMRR